MENENEIPAKIESINPVARKTNEEIDEDDAGNLIIGGKISGDKKDTSSNYLNTEVSKERDNANLTED